MQLNSFRVSFGELSGKSKVGKRYKKGKRFGFSFVQNWLRIVIWLMCEIVIKANSKEARRECFNIFLLLHFTWKQLTVNKNALNIFRHGGKKKQEKKMNIFAFLFEGSRKTFPFHGMHSRLNSTLMCRLYLIDYANEMKCYEPNMFAFLDAMQKRKRKENPLLTIGRS